MFHTSQNFSRPWICDYTKKFTSHVQIPIMGSFQSEVEAKSPLENQLRI